METDIAIVGAGPAGLSFARLLASSGLHITVIDRQSGAALAVPEFDGRDIALTRRSVCLLRELGVWQRLADEDRPEIRRARVLDGNSPYTLDFDPAGRNDAALGHIVSNHLIRQALYAEVCSLDNVELRTGTGVAHASRWQHTPGPAHRGRGQPLFGNPAHGRHQRFHARLRSRLHRLSNDP